MSHQADTAAALAPAHAVRPFYWSVRRELWENRATYLAPIAVVAVVLAAFAYASGGLPHAVRLAAAPDGAKAALFLHLPYAAAGGAVFVISQLVALFYCLGALHGERRDRSILFWKSLPVSDRTAVLAKAFVPLVFQPMVILAVTFVAHLAMLIGSTAVLAINGMDPGVLWSHIDLARIWVPLPYGLLVIALWQVPLVGWLLLVSAWARRTTFVWAVAPWLALALFEFLALHTHRVWSFLDNRIFGGYAQAFTVGGYGKIPIDRLRLEDVQRVSTLPDLWLGLVAGAALLAGCIWLRRTRDPI